VTRALVIGDALLDVGISPAGPMRPGADIPAAIRVRAGGQGANLAVRLARRGIATDLVCGLGTDPAGELLRSAVEAEGVRLVPIRVDATGSVAILLGADGERTMLSHRAPFGSDLDPGALPEAEWTVVSGYLLLEAGAVGLADQLAARAGHRALVGCTLPDDAIAGWLAAADALQPDLVIVNHSEAALLGRLDAPLVVTDASGASVTIGASSVSVRSATGPAAVDTTGAGDAFAAGLLAALGEVAWPPDRQVLETALGSAVELAAAVARTPGAQARVAGEPS
jgi:sugar/nucleoside kinase (ribokinase family)